MVGFPFIVKTKRQGVVKSAAADRAFSLPSIILIYIYADLTGIFELANMMLPNSTFIKSLHKEWMATKPILFNLSWPRPFLGENICCYWTGGK